MSVTALEGGWVMTADADEIEAESGRNIVVDVITVLKATDGILIFKDGATNTILNTGTISDGVLVQYKLGGMLLSKLVIDDISAGTATVWAYGKESGHIGAPYVGEVA